MKKLIIGFVIASCPGLWAAAPGPLTTLHAIHQLTNGDADRALPVAFEATVSYYRGSDGTMFVQDDGDAICVKTSQNLRLVPGDRVLVRGVTQGSFRPLIPRGSVALLRHGAIPPSVPATFSEMIGGQRDSMLVTVHAVVHSANLVSIPNSSARSVYLQMLTDGGYVDAVVDTDNATAPKDLLDAQVEVTGAEGGEFDDKMQQTGILLHVSSLRDVKVLERSNSNPWSLPVTPMNEILHTYYVQNLTHRVHVHGTITYYQPGAAVVLQDGDRSLWISTPSSDPLKIGDLADATGFPDILNGFLFVAGGEIQDSGVPAPVPPQPVTWRQLAHSDNKPEGHHYDLVSIEGQVVSEVQEATQDEYVLISDGKLFSAVYRHPQTPDGGSLPSMKQIPAGSRVRVTGICMPHSSDPLNGPVAFDMLLRSFADITVVAGPSWLSMRHLIYIVGTLLLLVAAVGAWGWALKAKVGRQTATLAAMAQFEQCRSRILEDINGSRPLREILRQITVMVSSLLRSAPCWCETPDGAELGDRPADGLNLRIIRTDISSRDGSLLGTLSAGIDSVTPPSPEETEALSVGARLATLAIETRSLYSDLHHRSEFDLLTDIHNRFSLHKHLDARIEDARRNRGVFALVYIDLDDFKQVNDVYGHRVGDLYLQEAALRMQRQMRTHDLLARLGGDEFAALIPNVHSRTGVEQIALRLEHCFDAPFVIEEHVLGGSASVGFALYPQDADTKDSLLTAADAAMYTAKKGKKLHQQLPAG
jgi:diguanylate cyclase (GGDEF)-like protein